MKIAAAARLAAFSGAFCALSPALGDAQGTVGAIFPTGFVDGPDGPEDFGWVRGKNQWDIDTGYTPTEVGGQKVAKAIRGSYAFCAQIRPPDYFVDCLGEQLQEIARALPPTGEYAEAKKILTDAADDLRRLARANANPAKPKVRARSVVSGKKITTKPLTPVLPERAEAVKAQAVEILQEAETKLLRSAEASDRRLIAYAQMAQAVGSNKTLLRSS